MKIVHIINSLEPGGAEKLLLDTLPLYNKKNIVVDVIVLNGFEYPFMKALQSLDCCSIHSLDLGSAYNPMAIVKLIPFLKRYDIAHVHLFPTQYWVVLAKFLSGSKIKLVYTEHSTSGRRIKSSFFQKTDPYFYRQYNKIIAISGEVVEVIKAHTKLDSTIELIPNGVVIAAFANSVPAQKLTLFPSCTSDLKIIIQVASFKEPKDQKTVIRSLLHLPENFQLVLVGEGAQKEDCMVLVKDLNLGHRVSFLGVRLDVPQLVKMADVAVVSSRYEGFSLTAVEAMASGKPVIASDVSALNTIVKGVGLLFKAGDEKQLAYEIGKLLSDKDDYQELVGKGLERAKQYDIHFMIDRHMELYKKIIND
jgi:glycosyltransferase involved in cell wall biosynthesis